MTILPNPSTCDGEQPLPGAMFASHGRVAMSLLPDSPVPLEIAVRDWRTPADEADLDSIAIVVANLIAQRDARRRSDAEQIGRAA